MTTALTEDIWQRSSSHGISTGSHNNVTGSDVSLTGSGGKPTGSHGAMHLVASMEELSRHSHHLGNSRAMEGAVVVAIHT